jgi:HK97 family phage major capsid protein
MHQLIQKVDDMVFVRQLATKFTLNKAQSIGYPALDADPEDGTWEGEISSADEDTAMTFGKREMTPYPLAKLLKVSNKLLRSSSLPIEALVQDRLAYKFGVTQEKAFLTGSGSNQPLGVMTASAVGISTDRDVSTGNTTTELRTDGLIEAKYSIKAGYWPKLNWIFHRDAVKQIRKLKNGEGAYIWQPGITIGAPDVILNAPVRMSEFQSNTFTSGLYVGILGDFSQYYIVDSLTMQLQVLKELYAATNQTGYIARAETDGMPVLEEAFARVTLA